MPQAHYTDPSFAAGVSNIVESLFGNPEKAGRFRVNKLQGDKLEQQVTGRQQFADSFLNRAAGSDIDPRALAAAVLGGISGADASGYMLAQNANTAGTPEEAIIGSLIGTGKTIGPNDAVSLGGQGRIRADNERISDEQLSTREAGLGSRNAADIAGALARQLTVNDTSRFNNDQDNRQSGINNDRTVEGRLTERRLQEAGLGSRNTDDNANAVILRKLMEAGLGSRNDADNVAQLARQNALPIQTVPGGTTTVVPGDLRAPTGIIRGTPTKSTVQGQQIRDIVTGLTAPTPENLALAGAKAPSAEKPTDVGFREVEALRTGVQTALQGLGADPATDPGLEDAVMSRAADIYQQTKNAPTAIQQAVSELVQATPRDNSLINSITMGLIGDDGGTDLRLKAPGQSNAAPAGNAPTATNPATGEKLILQNGQWVPMT